MQIIEDKALLLKVRQPEKITTVIPKSKSVSSHEVVVNWGLEEAQVLKKYFKAYAIIFAYYFYFVFFSY